MINSISGRNISFPFYRKNTDKPVNNSVRDKSFTNSLTDSFIKNSKQSLPVLLGFTAVLASSESKKYEIPLKEAFKSNIFKFFIPVLIFSSAVLANVENDETAYNKK